MLRTVILGLAVAAFAGCVGDEANTPDADDVPPATYYPPVDTDRLPVPDLDFTTAFDPTHGGDAGAHADPTQHEFEYGMTLVGYNPMTSPDEGGLPTSYDSSYIAIDTWGTYACVAHWSPSGGGGAEILDITDPTQPRHIGSAQSGMFNSDCMFTDDGDYLLIGAYLGVHDGLPIVPAPLGDLLANGVAVYDVKDKANPVFLFHDVDGTDANQYHNLFTAKINEVNYVFQTYTGSILELDAEGGDLKVVSSVPVADHDMWVGNHPVTGEWLMITGAAGGTAVYNVDDPTKPVDLGVWESHDGLTGWHRQWPLLNTVEGHALMLVAGEEGCSSPTYYTVLDFTDPNDLIEMGNWTIPNGCATQHEFESFGGYFATANYHQGLWLIDIGTIERAADPVTLGYYLPHNLPAEHGGTVNQPGASNPNVWGAAFDDRGYIVTADSFSGVYLLEFGATAGA